MTAASPDLFLAAGVAIAAVAAAVLVVVLWRRARRRRAGAAERGAAGSGTVPVEAKAVSAWVAFRSGLSRTRQAWGSQLHGALGRGRGLSEWLVNLEEALLLADVGTASTQRLLGALRKHSGLDTQEKLLAALKSEIRALLENGEVKEPDAKPLVILVAGVNGVGKTTTIGKLAYRYRASGKAVLLIAGDTFRAAAIEQLEVWANRVGCDLVRHRSGADPSAVIFDGLKAAVSRGADVAIIDTAGRLHVKANLMAELEKIVRVIGREIPGAPHEVFLVLDSTTGQNALSQSRLFREALPLTGVILTKLDGTAKGGAVLAVRTELDLPIRYVGLGEGVDDLRPFDAEAFAQAMFESSAG